MVSCGDLPHARIQLAVNSLHCHGRIFQHHGFFDFAGINRERKWRDHWQLAQLPVEMLDAVVKRVCFFRIEKNLRRLPISLLEERMIRFVRFQHSKNCFRAPMHLFARALMTRVIARYHQPSLGDATELPFYQFRSAQGQTQILLRAFALETEPPIFQRKFLKPPEGKEKARVINGDERVVAAAVLHSPSYDQRKRVIRDSYDEGSEKVMRKLDLTL